MMKRGKRKQMLQEIKWWWRIAAGYRSPVFVRGLLGILQVCVSLASVWVSKCLIDAVVAVRSDLTFEVVLLLACLLGRLSLGLTTSWMGSRQELVIENRLKHRLFAHLMEGQWTGREHLHTGDVVNRLEGDVATVVSLWCRSVPAVMVMTAQLLGALLFLASLDLRLALCVVGIMPVMLLASKLYMRRMRQLTRNIRTLDSRIQSHLQENLQHRILIRTLEYTGRAEESLTYWQDRLFRKSMGRTRFSLFSRGMVSLGFAAGYATAFLWGVFGLRDGSVTFGMLTAFLQLVAQVQAPMVDLSRQLPAFVQAFTSVERLMELFDLPREESGEPVVLSGPVGIRFREVTFHYPGSKRRIFRSFSHDFAPGSLTALVGETGAGKSTLIRLVLALLRPDEGSVTLYTDRCEVPVSPATRCNLSYVPQGNTLVSGTIRSNLLMGNPHATEAQLREALYTAAADFVFDLPHGLDSRCSEWGAGLSEGQAQRIAIARGLLRPGHVLLLDEPTSSLDPATECLLLQRLQERMGHRTLLVITHREALATLCSQTVRLQRS